MKMAKPKVLIKVKDNKMKQKKTSMKKDSKSKASKVGSLLLIKSKNVSEKKKLEKVDKPVIDEENVIKLCSESKYITEPDLSVDKVKKAVEIVFELINNKDKISLLDEEVPITLQITCIKIPKCPFRTVRYTIPHSLVNQNTEICLIVPDLQRGRKVDPELTISHYEDLLSSTGFTKIKVIPFTQLRLEYSQFEAKRRLLSLYDVFLVDGKLSGHVFHVLGKTFVKARKLPTSIRLSEKDLKNEITKALQKTSIVLTPRGNTTLTKVGHSKMPVEQITENIIGASQWLKSNYPGGWDNIETLYVKAPLTMAIPIHVSLKSPNDVKVPVVIRHRKNNFKDVVGELSTIPGATVSFDADGNIKVTREKVDGLTDDEMELDDGQETESNEQKKHSKAKNQELKKYEQKTKSNEQKKSSEKEKSRKQNLAKNKENKPLVQNKNQLNVDGAKSKLDKVDKSDKPKNKKVVKSANKNDETAEKPKQKAFSMKLKNNSLKKKSAETILLKKKQKKNVKP